MDNNRKHKVYKLVSILLASVLLVVGTHIAVSAWLSQNRRVKQSNVSMNLETTSLNGFYKHTNAKGYVSLSESNTTIFPMDDKDLAHPGSEVEFYIGLLNKSEAVTSVTSFGFDKPVIKTSTSNSDYYNEIPTKKGMYLGTQLLAYVDGYTLYKGARISDGELTYSSKTYTAHQDHESPVLLNEDLSTSQLLLAQDLNIDLGYNDAVEFHMVLEFVNNETEDQNDYANFGSNDVGGLFSRDIYFCID